MTSYLYLRICNAHKIITSSHRQSYFNTWSQIPALHTLLVYLGVGGAESSGPGGQYRRVHAPLAVQSAAHHVTVTVNLTQTKLRRECNSTFENTF